MSVKSHIRGIPVVLKNEEWFSIDGNLPISINAKKTDTCEKCGRRYTFGNCDPCLGELPGVKYACCGHGIKKNSYIVFDNGLKITGFNIVE